MLILRILLIQLKDFAKKGENKLSNKKIGLSVIIPCLNETEGMANLVSKLKDLEEKLAEPLELIFVDDGSTDSTYETLNRLYKERTGGDVKIIRHSENKGVGAAVKTGILNATGDYIAAIDSDCTHEPNCLLEMLDIIKKEKADLITASPYHPKGSAIGVPAHRLFLSKNLSVLYKIISNGKIHTYTSMFRIYRKEAIRGIDFKSNGYLAMAEILMKGRRKGLKILEYPATLKGREYGTSKAKVLKLIKEHLFFIAKILLGKY